MSLVNVLIVTEVGARPTEVAIIAVRSVAEASYIAKVNELYGSLHETYEAAEDEVLHSAIGLTVSLCQATYEPAAAGARKGSKHFAGIMQTPAGRAVRAWLFAHEKTLSGICEEQSWHQKMVGEILAGKYKFKRTQEGSGVQLQARQLEEFFQIEIVPKST